MARTFYIVVPSYNQANYIKQTLDSILTQQGVKVVCLVQDGGSSDSTVSILKKYRQRLQFVSKKDKGQTDAINQGLSKVIKYSKKPYQDIFAYLNSDDYYLPDALLTVTKAFDRHPEAKWVVGECQIVNAQGKIIQEPIRFYKRVLRAVWFRQLLEVVNPVPQPATFMTVSAAQAAGPFNQKLKYVMDYEYWLRLQERFGSPLIINATLAVFRIHGASKGTTAFNAQFAEQYAVATQKNPSSPWLFGQKLHNGLITFSYRLIK